MIGKTYLERGEPVVVLVRWRSGSRTHVLDSAGRPVPGAPRNVLIQHVDGTKTVRPFRGLRRISPD